MYLHPLRDERGSSIPLRPLPLIVPTDQHRPTARITGSIDLRPGEQPHLISEHLHHAAALARAAPRSIERPGDGDHAALTAIEADDAVMLGNACRADQTFVVHHGRGDVAGRAHGQDNAAAVGMDQVLVFNQRIQRRLIHHEADQAIAGKIERDLVARGERGGAQACGDDAFVAHFRGEQGDIAACSGLERALVDDRGGEAVFAEGVTAGEKIGIGEIKCGGDQAAHIHLRTVAEKHAIRIDEEHLAVGAEPALNFRRAG